MLDPQGRTHDWNMLNNRERHGVTGSATWEWRRDNPFEEIVRLNNQTRAPGAMRVFGVTP